MLDLVSGGRVDFGTGESSSEAELGGFLIDPMEKREMWEEGLRVALRCMTEAPFTGHARQVRDDAAAQRRAEAAPEAASAGLGGVQPSRHDPPRGAEGHRRARVRVRRPGGGAPLGRRLLRRRSPTEGVPIGDAVNANVACVTTFMCDEDEDTAIAPRARGRELLRLLARALLRVRSPRRPAPPTCGPSTSSAAPSTATTRKPSPRAGANDDRLGAKVVQDGHRRASAARSARPTRCASTCAATRSAASTR